MAEPANKSGAGEARQQLGEARRGSVERHEQRNGAPLQAQPAGHFERDEDPEAVAAEDEVASALRVKQGSPIFRIERTSYSTGNRPVDYEKLYYRGDLVRFVTRLARKVSQ